MIMVCIYIYMCGCVCIYKVSYSYDTAAINWYFGGNQYTMVWNQQNDDKTNQMIQISQGNDIGYWDIYATRRGIWWGYEPITMGNTAGVNMTIFEYRSSQKRYLGQEAPKKRFEGTLVVLIVMREPQNSRTYHLRMIFPTHLYISILILGMVYSWEYCISHVTVQWNVIISHVTLKYTISILILELATDCSNILGIKRD